MPIDEPHVDDYPLGATLVRPNGDGSPAAPGVAPAAVVAVNPFPAAVAPKSVGEMVGDVTHDLGDLVGMHVDLAKAELKDELSKTIQTVGAFGGAVFGALMCLVMLSVGMGWLLAQWMPTWSAFLIVATVWGLAAAALALMGRAKMKRIDPVPHETVEAVKGDVEWAQQQRS